MTNWRRNYIDTNNIRQYVHSTRINKRTPVLKYFYCIMHTKTSIGFRTYFFSWTSSISLITRNNIHPFQCPQINATNQSNYNYWTLFGPLRLSFFLFLQVTLTQGTQRGVTDQPTQDKEFCYCQQIGQVLWYQRTACSTFIPIVQSKYYPIHHHYINYTFPLEISPKATWPRNLPNA